MDQNQPQQKTEFSLISGFIGYFNKKDITNIDPRALIYGSQNVIINDSERVSTRLGYTLDGQANSALYPITAAYDWITSGNKERNVRAYYDTLEYRYVDSSGTVTWRTLVSGFGSNTYFNFTEWWSSTESKDFLLMVNQTSSVWAWTGAITTLASYTINTLTKEGTTTWAEERFLITGTRTVVIGGVTYTYTGGEGTTTLTGVTPDPTIAAPAVGSIAHQGLLETPNVISSTFMPGIIVSARNYVYYADLDLRDVYVSKNTDYTNFSFTAPTRLPGEGALLTCDSNPSGFAVDNNNVFVFGSKDDIYQTVFTLSADLTKESLIIQPFKKNPGQGVLGGQSAIGYSRDSVVYMTNSKSVDSLSRVQNQSVPNNQSFYVNTTAVPLLFPLSDPVKNEFLSYSYTAPVHIKYFQFKLYVLVPSESKLMIYDYQKGLWNPPQLLPGSKLSIINNAIYLHSSAVPETYKLFDGTSDNGNPIHHVASFAYNQFNDRSQTKTFDEWYTEGYLTLNTTITQTINYEYGGALSVSEKDISGTDNANIIFTPSSDSSLGVNPLGIYPLGSTTQTISALSKFRVIKELTKQDFYEVNVTYESNEQDAVWELLAFGPNSRTSTSENIEIKE